MGVFVPIWPVMRMRGNDRPYRKKHAQICTPLAGDDRRLTPLKRDSANSGGFGSGTELIRFEPEISFCNGSYLQFKKASVSVMRDFLLKFPQVYLYNGN